MSQLTLQLFRLQNRTLSIVSPRHALTRAAQLFFKPRRHASKAWEQQAEEQGTRVTLSNGCSAIVWGSGEKTVLMIHGWEGRATQMAGFVPHLLSKGLRVVSVDAPAHGKSPGECSNPKRFVDAMFAAAESFGPFHAVVGHSMGGGSALYAVLEGLPTEKIVTIAGPSNFETVSRRFARFIGLTKGVSERFIRRVEQTVGVPFERINLTARAHELNKPVLVVHDEGDRDVPYFHAQAVVNSLDNAQLITTRTLGHRAIMRDANVIEVVSEFVAQ